jgi:phosphatidylinositol alpha-mannosyltransferase
MSREWSRRGVEVRVYAPDVDDRQDYDTPATIVRFGRLLSLPANGSRAPLALSPTASRAVWRDIANFEPDVVHLHEPFAPFLGWSTLRHASNVVGTFHRSGGGPAYTLTGPLLRRLARRLRAAVAVSAEAQRTIREGAGVEACVLFNGFETDRFRAVDRHASDGVQILFIGRLEARKGVLTVVEAVREHNATSSTPWHLHVVGDGPLRDTLKEACAGDSHIVLHGRVDDLTKRQLLRKASVAVAASTHGESFGLVCLEPMAAEVPVVVSAIPGYQAAAGDCAAYFQPSDARDLRRAIADALTFDAEHIARARDRAERWSMRELVDRYDQLFSQIGDDVR